MSMLRNIEASLKCQEWLESLRWSNLVCIFLIFVPAYAGVKVNEQVGRLSKMAVISDGRTMDHADVLHTLREVEKWSHLEMVILIL
jgi:hypothetical protein